MTRVEELAKIIHDSWADTATPDPEDFTAARAALAWMAERVPHMEGESSPVGRVYCVDKHYRDAGPAECRALGVRCAWEEK